MRIRITKGVNLSSMKTFTVVDGWTQAGNAHRVLDFPWVGKTVFNEVCDSLTMFDDIDESQDKSESHENCISSIAVTSKSEKSHSVHEGW